MLIINHLENRTVNGKSKTSCTQKSISAYSINITQKNIINRFEAMTYSL